VQFVNLENDLLDVKVPLVARFRPQNSESSVGDEDGLVDAQDVRVAASNPRHLKKIEQFRDRSNLF
jgi:hypothetical protein